MSSLKKRYDAKQKKDAIRTMQNVIKLLESGEYIVSEHGLWPGLEGKLNLKVVIINPKVFDVS